MFSKYNGVYSGKRWLALVAFIAMIASGCENQQQMVTRVVKQTVVVTATPGEPTPKVQLPPTGEEGTIITVLADEQRNRWSARIPQEYESLKPSFALDNKDAIDNGSALYIAQDCAICHGKNGNGQGMLSPGLNPRPIDFTDAALMQRLGDNYLYWRLSEGGSQPPFLSAMPAWKDMLSEEERWQMIAYLRTLVSSEATQVALVGGVNVQVGLNLLQREGCFACHRYNKQGNFIGPDLQDVGTKRTVEQLLKDIVEPSAEIASGFADVMPRDYKEKIKPEDLDLLVKFLAGSVGQDLGQVAVVNETPTTTTEKPKATATTVAKVETTTPTTQTTAVTTTKQREGPPLVGSKNLPFTLDQLSTTEINGEVVFLPVNPFNIFVNYELGMHCVGFNMTYCCMIPPYNSIQAQALRSSSSTEPMPKLLSPEDNIALKYSTDNNTYSEGDKMVYWGVGKDVNGDGDMDDANDNFANYVWTHLYVYEDLEGTKPQGVTDTVKLRKHVGKDLVVQIDHGPSGKGMTGFADYAGEKGGNIVFTESRYGKMADIPLILTASHIWDALGLPLTAFSDGALQGGSHRTIDDTMFQPYQPSRVTMYEVIDGKPADKPMHVDGEPVSFIGTNPLDMPNCGWCHGTERANTFAGNNYTRYIDEYNYWKENYPDTSEYMARTKAGLISILEIHDGKHKTHFLDQYDPKATKNRLGSQGPVNCSDCHGDNVQGRLKSTDETPEKPILALAPSIHKVHLSVAADPDSNGRSQSCQICHPNHTSNPALNTAGEAGTTIDRQGNARFTDGDIRDSAGCFTGRDAHTNPDAKPPFFLNSIGKYMLENVSTVDGKIKGLYCTNCHNQNSQSLYREDNLVTPQQPGTNETLRDKSIEEIAMKISGTDNITGYVSYYLDPKVGAPNNPLVAFYKDHKAAPLPEVGEEGATYADASAGEDWWLSASEPHCADCHKAPFVESMGGSYFPIDQKGKYSLMRYSKAHADLACQSCHESTHGLYSVTDKGANSTDKTTIEQALQFSPDGQYTGPVTCVTCHAVGPDGVPVQLKETDYYNDYYASVVLIHKMRDQDYKLSIPDLVQKYPFDAAKALVDESMK